MRLSIAVVYLAALVGCQTIATYDQVAYDKQTSSLAEVLKLMDKATTPYSDNLPQIDATILSVEKAYEYDRGRPLNKITITQWDLIRDPNRNTFAGFLKLWRAQGKFSVVYIKEKKQQVANAFDQIIELESGKIR